MILTFTANASLDRVLFIPEFEPGENNRTESTVDAVGGKGYDTSVVLQGLGVKNRALGFIAGPVGRQLEALLNAYGVDHELIWVEGDTRLAHVLIETRLHRDSHITTNTGYSLAPADVGRALELLQKHLPIAQWLTMSGSIPPGAPEDLYAQLVNAAATAGVKTLVDAYGPPMRAAAAAHPTILKMNRSELAQTFAVRALSLESLAPQVEALRQRLGVENIIITSGGEGILALTGQGAFVARSPAQPAVNAAGAGDAVSGALAWRLSERDEWPQALRWAAAAGAATVLTARTAECHRADADRIFPLTTVQVLTTLT